MPLEKHVIGGFDHSWFGMWVLGRLYKEGIFDRNQSRRQWHPTPVVLLGKIPWTEEPGRLQSMGSLRVGHD